MRSRIAAVLSCAALAVTGCSASGGNPQITFYADGETVDTGPLIYCDALVRECDKSGDSATLTARPGQPVQISVPSEVSEAPWLVYVEYRNADGELKVAEPEFFSQGTQHAYTATGEGPGYQLLTVEVQQPGAAYAVDKDLNPILDAAGNPQLVARAVWSLHVTPPA